MKAFHSEMSNGLGSQYIKDEEDDVLMGATPNPQHNGHRDGPILSPQLILLQLETGDSVFLMLRQNEAGGLEFVSSVRKRVPKTMLNLEPGTHLAVDPSSRYMAVGCSESLFVVYALHSRQELSAQYQQGGPIDPIEEQNLKMINTRGIVLNLEFLYPSANDDAHIILLALVVRKGRTRMLLYEWETGRELGGIAPNTPKGHGLAPDCQMPLFIIPLTIKSAFLLIFEKHLKSCQRFLEGSPIFTDNDIDLPPTPLHHGKGFPLWTTWTRPPRREHFLGRDDIYLVREDGVLKFLEINTEDGLIKSGVNVGPLASNCGTALACLSYDTWRTIGGGGDLLVTGGGSCGGASYLVSYTSLDLNFSKTVELIVAI